VQEYPQYQLGALGEPLNERRAAQDLDKERGKQPRRLAMMNGDE